MAYKEQIKDNELIAKWRVIREVVVLGFPRTAVAKKFSMHRNTVGGLVSDFLLLVPVAEQQELLEEHGQTKKSIQEILSPLKNRSRKPQSNRRMATSEQTALIKDYVEKQKLNVGHNRLFTFITRRRQKLGTETEIQTEENDLLAGLTYAKLKGICKREQFKITTVKTVTRERRALYDYQSLAAFERLHYDTKTIPDSHALPPSIYERFTLNPTLPIIEWNIIDVKTRLRFLAYSHARSAEFGLHFLLLVIQYIRAHTIDRDREIVIGTDQGTEFFGGSKRKQAIWNRLLSVMNASIYCYEAGHDVRKNLIERSHRTDDEEFFIPRGEYITDRQSFLTEAKEYSNYFNCLRPHSGIGMNDLTPVEKLKSIGIYQAKKLAAFPTMILEETIGAIKAATNVIRLTADLTDWARAHPSQPPDQGWIADRKAEIFHFSKSAQNVLTYYLVCFFTHGSTVLSSYSNSKYNSVPVFSFTSPIDINSPLLGLRVVNSVSKKIMLSEYIKKCFA